MSENTPTNMNHPAQYGTRAEYDALFPVETGALEDLHAHLAALADERRLLDVAYRTIDTPVGALLLAATETGLVRVAFECEDFETVLASLAQHQPRVLEAPRRLDAVAAELDSTAGTRQSFDVPLDYALSTGFRQIVQRYLQISPTATPT